MKPASPALLVQTATPSTVRDVNRRIILNLIRLHQPISRADLSAQTGISRSNISEIVDELVLMGMVKEKQAEPSKRGRVPIHLSLNDDGFRVLGISIRADVTSVAYAGLSGRAQKVVSFPTPSTPQKFARMLASKSIHGSSGFFQHVGVSVPGLVNAESGEVLWLPALPEYAGFPLATAIQDVVGVPVTADNDCNLGALADLWLSAEEIAGLQNFVFLEIGAIGVGAGLILGREVYHGHDGRFAAEFGHMIVDPGGPQCRCGRQGCWELFVCGQAAWQRYRGSEPFDANSMPTLLAEARQGAPDAMRALEETARYLSIGISNIVLALNPELIVIAGEITAAWDMVGPMIENKFAPSKIAIRVRPASLSPEDLFLQGAISLALNNAFAKPRIGW
ncbi:ROK family transcriptional regulator [uncultured Paludibaculum sp.]|uniref:ROK family transcriptional regulator n=1 Tax=uncultured Paludibaculum sp. TaxID=1765020 RepID=UPI002AABF1F9|nr:ROK family transcriptional regulator [uncultured Paludibaculum sp.]